MKYAVIPIEYTYRKQGDIVLRSYIRALKKAKIKGLMPFGNSFAFVIGEVDENGQFIEYFTKRIIPGAKYIFASKKVMDYILGEIPGDRDLINKIMLRCLFGESIDLSFELSTIEERDSDIKEENRAYELGYSTINPYEGNLMDFDNFQAKMEKLNKSSNKGAHRGNFMDELYYHTIAYFPSSPKISMEGQELKSSEERKK